MSRSRRRKRAPKPRTKRPASAQQATSRVPTSEELREFAQRLSANQLSQIVDHFGRDTAIDQLGLDEDRVEAISQMEPQQREPAASDSDQAVSRTKLTTERVLGTSRWRRWTINAMAAGLAAVPVGMGEQAGKFIFTKVVRPETAQAAEHREPRDSRGDAGPSPIFGPPAPPRRAPHPDFARVTLSHPFAPAPSWDDIFTAIRPRTHHQYEWADFLRVVDESRSTRRPRSSVWEDSDLLSEARTILRRPATDRDDTAPGGRTGD
jgi:hypothetical protein